MFKSSDGGFNHEAASVHNDIGLILSIIFFNRYKFLIFIIFIVKPITEEQKRRHGIEYAKFSNSLPYGKEVSFAGYGNYEIGKESEILRVFHKWTMVTNQE